MGIGVSVPDTKCVTVTDNIEDSLDRCKYDLCEEIESLVNFFADKPNLSDHTFLDLWTAIRTLDGFDLREYVYEVKTGVSLDVLKKWHIDMSREDREFCLPSADNYIDYLKVAVSLTKSNIKKR
jgi:hypothetical protein